MVGPRAFVPGALAALLLALGCGTDDDRPAPAGKLDAADEAEAATGCPTPGLASGMRPKDGSACKEPGLVSNVGTISCSVTATCDSTGRWKIECGNIFPDGGKCC